MSTFSSDAERAIYEVGLMDLDAEVKTQWEGGDLTIGL